MEERGQLLNMITWQGTKGMSSGSGQAVSLQEHLCFKSLHLRWSQYRGHQDAKARDGEKPPHCEASSGWLASSAILTY